MYFGCLLIFLFWEQKTKDKTKFLTNITLIRILSPWEKHDKGKKKDRKFLLQYIQEGLSEMA